MYFLMLAPMVIPGVILGISILMFHQRPRPLFENVIGWDVKLLRPGYWLVVLGQVSFISTFVALVVIARLRKFDRTLEEAAMNLARAPHRGDLAYHAALPQARSHRQRSCRLSDVF